MTDPVVQVQTEVVASGLADYFKRGLAVLDSLLPIAQIVMMFIPGGQIPATALKVLSNLPNIVALTERALSGATGAEKKAFAVQTAQALTSSIEGVSTGGQAETWQKIGAVVPQAIDQIVAVINAFETPVSTGNTMADTNRSLGG